MTTTFKVIWHVTPESPRWLLETDQYEQSEGVLRQMALSHGRDLNSQTDFNQKWEELKSRYTSSCSKERPWSKAKALASNREYMTRLILVVFPWIAVGTRQGFLYLLVLSVKNE